MSGNPPNLKDTLMGGVFRTFRVIDLEILTSMHQWILDISQVLLFEGLSLWRVGGGFTE